MKNLIRTIVPLAAFLAVWSCDEFLVEEPPKLEIDCANHSIGAGGGVVKVNVICDKVWTVSLEDKSWGTIENLKVVEDVGGSLEIRSGLNTGSSRRNVLTISSGTVSQTLDIIQGGAEDLFSPASASLKETEPVTVTFKCSEPWKAATEADWIVLSPSEGPAGDVSVKVSAKDPFIDKGTRSAMVRFTIGSGSIDYSVTQNQTDVIRTSVPQVDLSYDACTFELGTSHNVDYDVIVSGSWLRKIDTKALDTGTIVFEADDNDSVNRRSAEISFKGLTGDVVSKVTVTQEGLDPILLVSIPGAYSIWGNQYFFGISIKDAQLSTSVDASGKVVFRILYPGSVSMCTVSGLTQSVAKGDDVTLNVEVYEGGKQTRSGEFECKALRVRDGRVWLKSGSSYFIIDTSL